MQAVPSQETIKKAFGERVELGIQPLIVSLVFGVVLVYAVVLFSLEASLELAVILALGLVLVLGLGVSNEVIGQKRKAVEQILALDQKFNLGLTTHQASWFQSLDSSDQVFKGFLGFLQGVRPGMINGAKTAKDARELVKDLWELQLDDYQELTVVKNLSSASVYDHSVWNRQNSEQYRAGLKT